MFKNMGKKNLLVLVIVVIIVVFLAMLQYKATHAGQYSVVYLTTGEVYVGQLSTFPDLTLKNSYILQVTKDATDATKTNFQLQPVNQALWAPSELHLVEKNVIFYGPLLPGSKIAQTLAAQGK
jgi:hypothetical protein